MAHSKPDDWVWVPPGVIIPWAGTDLKKLPENWVLAVGTTFDRGTKDEPTEYGALFGALGFTNGGTGRYFNTPNLQGKFIRGDTSLGSCFNNPNEKGSLRAGQVYRSKTVASDLAINMAYVANDYNTLDITNGSSVQCMDRVADGLTFDLLGSDAESRPNNISMYWIIKTKDLPKGQAQDIPIGGLVSFAGDPADIGDSFPALILADGSVADNKQVPDLSTVLGTNYTTNTNSKTTSMPDVRGQFIRGWTNAGDLDPDWDTRTPAPGAGKFANGVPGSTQTWATKLPADAKVQIPWFNGNPVSTTGCYGGDGSGATKLGVSYGGITKDANASGGAVESRPPNAAMTWYVSAFGPKYQGDKSTPDNPKSYLPVGSVIAIPGDPDPSYYLDKNIWLPCGGGEYESTKFPFLAQILQNRWGVVDADKFVVPNLQGQFVRGRNVDDKKADVDPEWNKRLDANGKPLEHPTGTGSYQRSATGKPVNMAVEWGDWGNPTSTQKVMQGFWATHKVSEPSSSYQKYGISGTWDNENTPACVIVTYWIRAA